MNSPALSIICHITFPSPAKFMTPVKNHTLLITTMLGILKARQVHLYNYKYSMRLAIKKQQNKIESQYLVDTHEESSKAKSLFVFLLLSFPNLLPFNFDQSIVIIGMHISYDLHIPIHSIPFRLSVPNNDAIVALRVSCIYPIFIPICLLCFAR